MIAAGTVLCGLSVLCCGRPRLKVKEGRRTMTVLVNLLVGVMQLFTVPVFLVGWAWSFVWGVYMVILSSKKSRFVVGDTGSVRT